MPTATIHAARLGSKQFLYSGRKIVIRNWQGTMVFGWVWSYDDKRMDDQTGFNCAIFRNETGQRSSEIILICETIALGRWGVNRMFTYVDPRKIRSANPGYCFKKAGWVNARNPDGKIRTSKDGKHLLIKEP